MNTVVSQNDKQMKEIVEKNLRNYFYCHYSDITRAHQLITFPHDLCSNERKTYELNSYLQKCKILIVTANSVEQSVVTHCLAGRLEESSCKTSFELVDRFVADGYNYQIATCRLKNGMGDVQFAHLHAADISSNTDGGAEDAVLAALKRFRPNFVVSLGCAYGWDPSQSYGQELGDVLLSKELIAYSEKNKRTNNKLTFKSDVIYPISTELKPYLQTYEEEHNWVSKAFKVY